MGEDTGGPPSGPSGVRSTTNEESLVVTSGAIAPLDHGWDEPASAEVERAHALEVAPADSGPDLQVDFEDLGGDCTRAVSTKDLMHRQMYERFLDSDYPAALTLAESILEMDAGNDLAIAVVAKCRETIATPQAPPVALEIALDAVLRVTIPTANLTVLPLDPRTMFLLSMLDGSTDLETALALAALPAEEVMPKLADLVRRGILVPS